MFSIEYPFKKEILACGAHAEDGFCLTKKNCGYIINSLGNLNELSIAERYQREIERMKQELKIKPKLITHDLHPEYSSTKYARSLDQESKGLKYFPVQHHHAHLASCMGENRIESEVIGVVFDAGGWGEDGQIWGGEFFVGNLQGFKRIAHLKYIPIAYDQGFPCPSWQLAASYLYQAFGENFMNLDIDFVRSRKADDWQILKRNPVNQMHSSSLAGLFDAVSALATLREKVDYEGQGSLDLERIVNRSSHVANKIYEFTIKQDKDKFLICPETLFQNIVEDLRKNISKSIISAAFHNTIIEMVRRLCHDIKQVQKVKDVVLTGSVFQNKVLFNRLKNLLAQDGFKVVTHQHFSCGDNNICFGQAVLANPR